MVKSTKFYQQLLRRRRMLSQLAESREQTSPPMGDDAVNPKTRKSNSKS